jgi:hypothetical protein
MSDRFEQDLMEDLMSAPEGHADELEGADALEGADEFEESDALDESDEFEEGDALEEAEEFEAMDGFEGEDGSDEFEEAMTDALEAEGGDEFWGGFRKVLRTVGNVARRVAPIAKMIPIPQAQLIGRAADLVGKVMADEGDELDALDAFADFADDEDSFDALAPAIAGLAIRGSLKHKSAHLPRAQRRQLVKVVSSAAKQIARKHGPRAVVALPGIVRAARNLVVRRQLPAKHLPHLVKRATRVALRSPRALRRFASVGARLRTGTAGYRGIRRAGRAGKWRVGGASVGSRSGYGGTLYRGAAGGTHASFCPNCRRRSYKLRGPVTLTIQSL